MTELRHTASGLRSLHIFFRVDRIVYCEGGNITLSQEDIVAGGGDPDTLDVFFWQTVFEVFGKGDRTHFKSVGSKAMLKNIAAVVIADDITSVIVCMDRDHDWHYGNNLNDGRVLYTHGYCWENDTVRPSVLKSIFFMLRNRNAASVAVWRNIEVTLDLFLSQCCRFASYDIHFIARGKQGMFPRAEPCRALVIPADGPPSLNLAYLRERLAEMGYSRGPRLQIRIGPQTVAKDVFGKLLSRFAYHVMKALGHDGVGNFHQYRQFMRMAVAQFGGELRKGLPVDAHAYYRGIVGTLGP